jgi:lactate dehydrogenase-like 2-hydroxyacid dehydrogenase
LVADDRALVKRLRRFDVVCVMRERTPLPRTVIESLPGLKMIASTGTRNRSVDADAASERRNCSGDPTSRRCTSS